MALINCPRCGNHISDKATKCPKCGVEITKTSFPEKSFLHDKKGQQTENISSNRETNHNRWKIIVFPIIVICIAAGVIFYLYEDNKNTETKVVVEHDIEAEKTTIAEQVKIADQEILIEKERQDSLIAVQKESERLEQLRQDSIKAIEKRIENAAIHWYDLIKYDSTYGYIVLDNKVIKNKLKNKDFEQTNHFKEYITDTSWEDHWEEGWTYTFFKDKDKKRDKLYEIEVFDTDCAVKITIYDSKLLSLLRKELKGKKLSAMPDGEEAEWKYVYYEGNFIGIFLCGD